MNRTAEIEPRSTVHALEWRNDQLVLLDQRRLPAQETYLELQTANDVAGAIQDMVVRGAPAIGIAAAYGVVLSALSHRHADGWRARVETDMEQLAAARPTAVNLAWALARMQRRLASVEHGAADALLSEARAIHAEDIEQNQHMAALGSNLLDADSSVLTHCNTGALATGGWGTALGVIRQAHRDAKIARVFASETRPWQQGARLTCWELCREGIGATLITDSAAGALFKRERVAWLIVGADRIAANGDVANKIGTYGLAVLARYYGARVMVVAPTSTVDLDLAEGAEIPIESRAPEEIWCAAEWGAIPAGLSVLNSAFDITPAALVDVIVTERGCVFAPRAGALADLLA